MKWPKPNSKEWETINTDLSLILNNIKGSAEKKLEKIGDLIFSYEEEKCGVKEQVRKKDMLPTPKSRRLQETCEREATAKKAVEKGNSGRKGRHQLPSRGPKAQALITPPS